MSDKLNEERIKSTSQFEFQIQIRLSEQQARALRAITSYGDKAFLEVFYKYLGESYLKPHEDGLEALFETIRKEVPKHLSKFDDMRDVWKGEKKAVRP